MGVKTIDDLKKRGEMGIKDKSSILLYTAGFTLIVWNVAYGVLSALLYDEGWKWVATLNLVMIALVIVNAIWTMSSMNVRFIENIDSCLVAIALMLYTYVGWLITPVTKGIVWLCMVYALFKFHIPVDLKIATHIFIWTEPVITGASITMLYFMNRD